MILGMSTDYPRLGVFSRTREEVILKNMHAEKQFPTSGRYLGNCGHELDGRTRPTQTFNVYND